MYKNLELKKRTKKLWREKNKKRLLKEARIRYRQNREKESLRKKLDRRNNPEKYSKRSREFYQKNRDRIFEYRRKNRPVLRPKNERRNLDSWKEVIPKVTQCECCGKDIFFACGDNIKSIHFDHRKGGTEPIKDSPSRWLREHKRTPSNEMLWRQSDFGKLCRSCNIALPTENRIQFLRNATKYVGGI
jgi:hypothetical protein